jgi:hypothetical protein
LSVRAVLLRSKKRLAERLDDCATDLDHIDELLAERRRRVVSMADTPPYE